MSGLDAATLVVLLTALLVLGLLASPVGFLLIVVWQARRDRAREEPGPQSSVTSADRPEVADRTKWGYRVQRETRASALAVGQVEYTGRIRVTWTYNGSPRHDFEAVAKGLMEYLADQGTDAGSLLWIGALLVATRMHGADAWFDPTPLFIPEDHPARPEDLEIWSDLLDQFRPDDDPEDTTP